MVEVDRGSAASTLCCAVMTLALCALGCNGGDSDGTAAVDASPPDAADLEAPDAEVPDAEVPDAMPPTCLTEGARPASRFATDPIPGLVGVRADVDPNGDGAIDLALAISTPAATELRVLDGRTGEPLGAVIAPADTHLELLRGVWPPSDRIGPADIAGAPYVFAYEAPAPEAEAAVRLLRASDLATVGRVGLPLPARELTAMPHPDGWLGLVTLEDGRCAAFVIDGPTGDGETRRTIEEDAFADNCWFRPAWDANGDGLVDYIVIVETPDRGSVIVNGRVHDARTLEPIIVIPAPGGYFGFVPPSPAEDAPPPGPFDARGAGSEFVSALTAGGLQLRFHDPDTLQIREEGIVLQGDWSRVEFALTPRGVYLVAEELRPGIRFLHIFELDGTRRRAELGPFVNLWWTLDADLEGDGYAELFVRSGPDETGLNSDVEWLDPSDGSVSFAIDAQRSARFDPILRRDGMFWRSANLDGCEGDESVILRRGVPSDDGSRPSRWTMETFEGDEVFRADDQRGRVHQMAIADLDGAPPFEIIEVRSTSGSEATLEILRVGPSIPMRIPDD